MVAPLRHKEYPGGVKVKKGRRFHLPPCGGSLPAHAAFNPAEIEGTKRLPVEHLSPVIEKAADDPASAHTYIPLPKPTIRCVWP